MQSILIYFLYICCMDKKITAHVPFDRDLYEKIKAKAKEKGLTVSAYIRLAVLEKLTP